MLKSEGKERFIDDNCEVLQDENDPLLKVLHPVIKWGIRILSVIMVGVILFGIMDVLFVIYQRLMAPPFMLLKISDLLATFGAFLAVLIAIEIFINITLYLKTAVIPVKLVVATALMAIARKVIIFDFEKVTPEYIYATAAVVLALGITYWLIAKKQ
ncbi:MAG: phosphate-starvation-inducible PsiE family protein [Sulfurimonadaceae bacterium]|nr:phosphate-starvation-inducible PsiE family protein [Sulfurimonadaceae bacterium]